MNISACKNSVKCIVNSRKGVCKGANLQPSKFALGTKKLVLLLLN